MGGLLLLGLAQAPALSTHDLHPDLQHTLLILRETWEILDRFGEDIWPGWKTYRNELYFTGIPGRQDIWINREETPGEGYQALSETLNGRKLYLRNPSPIYHFWNRSYSIVIRGNKISAIQFRAFTKPHFFLSYQYLREITGMYFPVRKLMRISSSPEYRMGLIAHEAFHHWQKKCNPDKFLLHSPPPHLPGRDSRINPVELEGKALYSAFISTSPRLTIYRIHQFLALRQERWKNARPAQIGWERREEYNEGTAEYIQAQVALHFARDEYKPRFLHPKSVPFYGPSLEKDLRRLYALLILNSPKLGSSPQERQWRCYYFGLAQAFLLDRLCGPKWKENILNDYSYLDQLLEKYSDFSPETGKMLLKKARSEVLNIQN